MSDHIDVLSTATTDELIDELEKRCPSMVIAMDRPAKVGTDGEFFARWNGNFITVMGLATRLDLRMKHEAMKAIVESEENE